MRIIIIERTRNLSSDPIMFTSIMLKECLDATELRTAKTQLSFGHSECNRINNIICLVFSNGHMNCSLLSVYL